MVSDQTIHKAFRIHKALYIKPIGFSPTIYQNHTWALITRGGEEKKSWGYTGTGWYADNILFSFSFGKYIILVNDFGKKIQ